MFDIHTRLIMLNSKTEWMESLTFNVQFGYYKSIENICNNNITIYSYTSITR